MGMGEKKREIAAARERGEREKERNETEMKSNANETPNRLLWLDN